MSHPYFHAVSAAKEFGGAVELYQPLQSWMDSSKAAWTDPRHRAALHSSAAVAIARRIFGERIGNASVEELVHRHIREDVGFVATPSDWVRRHSGVLAKRRIPSSPVGESIHRQVGGKTGDYLELERFFEPFPLEGDLDPRLGLLFLNNSFGIFIAEQVFGITISRISDGKVVPVRFIAERIVARNMGGPPPTVRDCFAAIPPERWHSQAAHPLSTEG